MTADSRLLEGKHNVLNVVAKLAWDGELDEKRDDIPYEMVPGPIPTERCCIYKEREVIRQRVKLAEGIPATGIVWGQHNNNIMQVIFAACADCPISTYTVTENCQNCIGKPCLDACKFGAMQPGRYHSFIETSKCKECGMCAKACPYNAIAHLTRPCKNACEVNAITYEENGLCVIDMDKCIRCGHCIHACPFGAIGTLADIIPVITALKDPSKKVYLMAAPATEGQHGEGITMNSWKEAALKVGFDGFVSVELGADAVAAAEADEWAEAYAEGKKKTTSCCPAFVNMINKHFPELSDCISTTVSPMCSMSRMIKAKEPDAVTVFLGPCVSKKSEAHEFGIEGNADYVLTFSEIDAIMKAAGVELEPSENKHQEGSVYGKNFAISGGVTAAAVQSLKELGTEFDARVNIANGADECRLALNLLKHDKLTSDFIEGMVCEGGCVNGPSHITHIKDAGKARADLIGQADDRAVRANVAAHPDLEGVKMHR